MHGIPFQFLASFSIFLQGFKIFIVEGLARFIPRCFIFLYAIKNESVSMICFSVCLLLMSRKDTDLCELILYPTSLLNLFTVSRHFLIQFLGALMYHLMSPANRDSLSSSFPICDPLISFFYLLAPDTTLNTMLKMSKDSGQPCAITDFSVIPSSFSLFMMICVFLIYNVYDTEVCSFYDFYHEGMSDFDKGFL